MGGGYVPVAPFAITATSYELAPFANFTVDRDASFVRDTTWPSAENK